jgi:fucose permease
MGTIIQQFGARSVIFWCLIGVLCGLLSSWFVPFHTLSPFGLCFASFCLGPIYPTIISLMPSLVPVRLLTGSIGFIVSLACVGGALFPWVIGNIAQAYSISVLLPFIGMLVIVLGILWISLHTLGG